MEHLRVGARRRRDSSGRRLRHRSVAVLATLALAGTGCSTAGRDNPASRPSKATEGGVMAALSKLPLSFVPNRGQIDGPVSYYVQGSGSSLYFGPGGVTYSLTKPTARREASADRPALPSAAGAAHERWAVKLDFVGANPVAPTGVDLAKGVVSYFGASAETSHTAIPTYTSIAYRDLWPGIDMVYSGTRSQLKYDLVVHPGADPSRIKLAYRGAERVGLNKMGQIEVTTPAGGFTDDKPFTYQDVGGRRVEVPSSYVLEPGTVAGSASVAIPVGDYDATKDLVIDPAVFVYAGFIGGSKEEEGHGIAVDAAGNAYVTGSTQSSPADGFPATVGPSTVKTNQAGGFVAKVSADGTQFLYAGYVESIAARAIAVDQFGAAYVTGGGAGPLYPAFTPGTGGSTDAVVLKVNPSGTGIDYAGSVGGSSSDDGYAIAVDAAGSAYIGGDTLSSDFPTSVGPDLTHNGGYDAFVAKVNPTGTGLDYAGYIGGTGYDGALELAGGFGLDVDPAGAAYVTGRTSSGPESFPVKVGPDLTLGGSIDVFVAKVNPAGSGLDYAGYIGGNKFEQPGAIAVDAAGNAYVVGSTGSPNGSFPRLVGPDLSRAGPGDAFVVKVNAAGTGFAYAGFIGSRGNEVAKWVAVDGAGAAYVVGWTTSQRGFALNGPDLTAGGGFNDGFVAKVTPDGMGFAYVSYIGGDGLDGAFGVDVDPAGNAYVTGATSSRETTFPTTVGPDLVLNQGPNPSCGHFGECRDAYVVKVSG